MKSLPLRPGIAYTAKLLLLHQDTIETKQSDFKKLRERHGLSQGMLLKMEEEGLIKIQNCTLSWDILLQYQAIAKKRARLYGYSSAPSDDPYEEEETWHEPFYRDSWPFGKNRYEELKAIQHTKMNKTPISLGEIKRPERFPIWLTVDDFDPWFYLDFDLYLPIKKLKSFLNEYADAFIEGSMEDTAELFSYRQHKEKAMLFLKNKIDSGINHANIWIIPSGEGYENHNDLQFVWDKQEIKFVRPMETILAMEREGLIEIKEITDHSLGVPEHIWGFFLQYKVSVTNKALKLLKGSTMSDRESRPLKMMNYANGILVFQDDQNRRGSIQLDGGLFGELWERRRVFNGGKISTQGEDSSLYNLRHLSGSPNDKAVKQKIYRYNSLFAQHAVQIKIEQVGSQGRRLEIHECESGTRLERKRNAPERN